MEKTNDLEFVADRHPAKRATLLINARNLHAPPQRNFVEKKRMTGVNFAKFLKMVGRNEKMKRDSLTD